MIVGTLAVERDDVNWPKLCESLVAVLGPVGFAHDGLPGEVRVLADAPIDPALLDQAQAVIDAHDPTPTEAQREAARAAALGEGLGPRERLLAALALRASSGWSSMPATARQRVQAVIDQAADRVRELLA